MATFCLSASYLLPPIKWGGQWWEKPGWRPFFSAGNSGFKAFFRIAAAGIKPPGRSYSPRRFPVPRPPTGEPAPRPAAANGPGLPGSWKDLYGPVTIYRHTDSPVQERLRSQGCRFLPFPRGWDGNVDPGCRSLSISCRNSFVAGSSSSEMIFSQLQRPQVRNPYGKVAAHLFCPSGAITAVNACRQVCIFLPGHLSGIVHVMRAVKGISRFVKQDQIFWIEGQGNIYFHLTLRYPGGLAVFGNVSALPPTSWDGSKSCPLTPYMRLDLEGLAKPDYIATAAFFQSLFQRSSSYSRILQGSAFPLRSLLLLCIKTFDQIFHVGSAD